MITKPYRILRLRDTEVLLCLVCDRWSANLNDLAYTYCGYCHVFLDELPEHYRRAGLARLSRRPDDDGDD